MPKLPYTCIQRFMRPKHCCACEDCARFERELDWCICCGAKEPGIGWDNVCTPCDKLLLEELADA